MTFGILGPSRRVRVSGRSAVLGSLRICTPGIATRGRLEIFGVTVDGKERRGTLGLIYSNWTMTKTRLEGQIVKGKGLRIVAVALMNQLLIKW